MATVIRHRKSSTGGSSPTTSNLALGEIAINTNDGEIYIKKSTGGTESIVKFSPALGSAAASTLITVDTFTGDGSTRVYALSSVPAADQFVFADVNGIRQHISTYSLAGNSLTFTTAPSTGDLVEIRVVNLSTAEVILRDYASYIYTITSTTSSVSGSDDNSATLAYDVGKVNVYQNGVRLVNGSDYTATNGTAVTLTTAAENGDVIEVESHGRASIVDNSSLTPGTSALTTTTANQSIDTFPTTTIRTAKYIVQATAGTAYHSTEITVMHDGTNTYTSEYGTVQTGASLFTLSADINSGNVRLLCTPSNNNTTIKFQRMTVGV